MTSVEDRLRELGLAVTSPALPTAARVMHRGRQRRRRRRGIGLAAAALIGTSSGLAVRGLRADDDHSVRTTTPAGVDPTGPTSTDQTGERPDGPGTRAVPDVIGLTVAEARPIIENLGLAVDVPSGSDASEIVAQDPDPGTPLRVGRAVTLQPADLEQPARVDGALLRGRLLDGRAWTVGHSTRHGLCTTLGPTDLGCDDIGPAIAPDADPATPRIAADRTGFAHGAQEAGALVYGFLPAGAETVELVHDDGRTLTTGLVIQRSQGFWAMPVRPGDNPDTVIYRDAAGTEVTRYPLGR